MWRKRIPCPHPRVLIYFLHGMSKERPCGLGDSSPIPNVLNWAGDGDPMPPHCQASWSPKDVCACPWAPDPFEGHRGKASYVPSPLLTPTLCPL